MAGYVARREVPAGWRRDGRTQTEITRAAACGARSADPTNATRPRFALMVMGSRGQVPAAETATLGDAGIDSAAIVEIPATVPINMFVNIINNLLGAQPDLVDRTA
jgi:hypothetical protein